MKKSELYARYQEFNNTITEISAEEFMEVLTISTKDDLRQHQDGATHVTEIKTDGMSYFHYTSHWHVGWQGDVDIDQFFCKKETVSKAEMEEMRKLWA
jgi:hypothetical protein